MAQAFAIYLNCLRRSPNCLLSVVIMCAAVSEEAAASDILVGAQPRIMCWTRARSSSESVDTATARRASERRMPRVWDCPADDGRGSFCTACIYHGSSRRLAPATGRVRLTLPESATSCSCAIASESHRIACGTWTRQLCARFQQASAGGPRVPNQQMSSPRAPSSRSHLPQT